MEGETASCIVDGEDGSRECIGGSWGPCEPLPPPTPALMPAYPTAARTNESITLTWEATPVDGEHYRLQYQVGATWTTLRDGLVSPATVLHSGLQPDTRHCYRVEATGGPYGGRLSTPLCRYTTDGTGAKTWRVEIELRTADVEGADTDDSINVKLNDGVINDPDHGLGPNRTWLDYGHDDFERGQTFRYDLKLDYIPLVSDITRIRVTKSGTDNWCLAELRLRVNELPVYTESFEALPGGCRWLNNWAGYQPSYEVDHSRLRAHPKWQAYTDLPRILIDPHKAAPHVLAILWIPRVETESRIEALVGDLIHPYLSEAHWGGLQGRASVEADPSPYYDDRLAVDLDLEGNANNWPDPELDIDFDLEFQARCENETEVSAEVKTRNLQVNVDFDWFTNFLGLILPCGPIATPIAGEPIPNCVTYLEDYIEDQIMARFQPIVETQRETLPEGYRCLDARVELFDDPVLPKYGVDLVFELEVQPAPAPAPAPPAADFGITCAPASLTIPNLGSGTSTCTVTSANGFSNPVSLGCTGLPWYTTCAFSPASVTPPANGSVSSILAVSVGLAAAGSYTFRAEGAATSTHRRQTDIALTVAGSNVHLLRATFDATLQAPSCGSEVGGSCDTGSSLVQGRGTGGAEPNASNTIGGACADGEDGPLSGPWNSIGRITVSTTDGSNFAPGKTVRIDAAVWASDPSAEAADFFYTADAANPRWTLIGTIVPAAPGAQTLSTAYRLPSGAMQAVRVQFRQGRDGSACAVGAFNDRDDVVFTVGETP